MQLEDLTLGIEEEYQIVDPETRELTSFISDFMQEGATIFRDQVKPEFLQSQIETGTHVCRNVREARQEVTRLRSMVNNVAHKFNRRIVAAGTHPFSRWRDQIVTNHERYHGLANDLKILGRRLLIFGTHIHIGIPDPDLRIDIMQQITYFVPHILMLSTSSPFWIGEPTGLKSYRAVLFEDLPRTGLPLYFDNYQQYQRYVQTLVKTGCIDDATKIWWDVRPHPKFPTLEFRMCDCVTKVDDIIAIAALLQALVATLIDYRKRNHSWRIYRRSFIAENKWRAIKEGLDGELIDFGKETSIPSRLLMEEILQLVSGAVEKFGTHEEMEHIRRIVREGTSADRQLRKYEQTGSLESVVDMLIEETIEGC